MKTKALSREERKVQILQAFRLKIMNGENGDMTIADIARLMHLSASSKLRDMVMELVIDGTLDFTDQPIPGVAKYRRIYSPNAEHFKSQSVSWNEKKRKVKINSKQSSYFAEIGS